MFTVQALADQEVFTPYRPAELTDYRSSSSARTICGSDSPAAPRIMYNKDLVPAEELPTSLLDLTDPRWKGQIAAAGSTNGSMQAQIAVMRQLLGETETEARRGLLDNEVTFFGGHTDVRKAVGAGEFKLGLVNHYYYHLQAAEGSNVGIIYPDQGEGQMGLITNATAAAVVRGGANPAAAQDFIDFLVSAEGQRLFAEQNYEYPLLPGIELREGVAPLADYRLAEVDIAQAAGDSEATFALFEVGIALTLDEPLVGPSEQLVA